MALKKQWWLAGGAVALAGLAVAIFVFEVQSAFIDERVDEALVVTPEMALLARGAFHPVAHAGAGTAAIYRVGDKCLLRLTDFAIDNGPTLRLRLIDIADASDDGSVASSNWIDVAALKGNIGNQTYELPFSYDAAQHRAVVVWCERFGVNFVTAPLEPANP
jgi:hypothetical protein